ncbi:hypothetical protein ABPG75_006648 [Micractinium tetrahymenae]
MELAIQAGRLPPRGLLAPADLSRLVLPALRVRPPAGWARRAPGPGIQLRASFEGMRQMAITELACGAGLFLLHAFNLEGLAAGEAFHGRLAAHAGEAPTVMSAPSGFMADFMCVRSLLRLMVGRAVLRMLHGQQGRARRQMCKELMANDLGGMFIRDLGRDAPHAIEGEDPETPEEEAAHQDYINFFRYQAACAHVLGIMAASIGRWPHALCLLHDRPLPVAAALEEPLRGGAGLLLWGWLLTVALSPLDAYTPEDRRNVVEACLLLLEAFPAASDELLDAGGARLLADLPASLWPEQPAAMQRLRACLERSGPAPSAPTPQQRPEGRPRAAAPQRSSAATARSGGPAAAGGGSAAAAKAHWGEHRERCQEVAAARAAASVGAAASLAR